MRIACALLLISSVAHADKPSADAWYPRVSAGVGIGYRAGELSVLKASGGSIGAQLEFKVAPALFVDASYDFARATGRDEHMILDDVQLSTHSAGLAIRNLLMSFGDQPRRFGGDMFFTTGVVREAVRWRGGGLERNALMIGAGTTMILPSETSHRHVRFGFRMLFARAPDPAKRAPGCDGPCDTPTTTQPYDYSIVMEVSCHLGR
jgi:hypothetical protein